MSSYRSIKQKLESIFGKICMIEELGIRYIPMDERRKLKGYTKYDNVLTYHHIKEKHLGGLATLENGALIRGYNHRWLHTLNSKQKEQINQAIQEYKSAIMSGIKIIDNNFIYEKRKSMKKADMNFDTEINRNVSSSHEDGSQTVLQSGTRVYTPRIETSSDTIKLILRSALKNRAQEILADTSLPDNIRKEEFDMIEMYIRYISDFENNQRKLAEYDEIEKYMVDDGR